MKTCVDYHNRQEQDSRESAQILRYHPVCASFKNDGPPIPFKENLQTGVTEPK